MPVSRARPSRWWLALAVTAFITNLVWENAHGVLYAHAIPGWRYLLASGGDVLLTATGVALAWPLRRRSRRTWLIGTAVVLTLLASMVELHALATMRWTYTEAMPTVLSMGLSPLLQLPVTGLASIETARRATRRASPSDRPLPPGSARS